MDNIDKREIQIQKVLLNKLEFLYFISKYKIKKWWVTMNPEGVSGKDVVLIFLFFMTHFTLIYLLFKYLL